ncbi:hypothetical protein MAH4_26740 [Sessilibacter sp. MAH4]
MQSSRYIIAVINYDKSASALFLVLNNLYVFLIIMAKIGREESGQIQGFFVRYEYVVVFGA